MCTPRTRSQKSGMEHADKLGFQESKLGSLLRVTVVLVHRAPHAKRLRLRGAGRHTHTHTNSFDFHTTAHTHKVTHLRPANSQYLSTLDVVIRQNNAGGIYVISAFKKIQLG